MWTTKDMPDLTGKIALVTGANTGIGFETAKALYSAGASVTLAVRSEAKGIAAKEQIAKEGGKGILEVALLDLAGLVQVGEFATQFQKRHAQLDILVNNAGVMIPPPSLTEEGFELQFGVNFLGHFALTGYLFPLLKQSVNARVVTLSSGAAIRAAGIDFDNLRLEQPYDAWREYATSKLADLLFTYEFNRKLKENGSTILSVAAHPGVTKTDLQRNISEAELQTLLAEFKEVMEPWQGALPTLFAATDASVIGGTFYGPDGENEYVGYPAPSKHHTAAMADRQLAADLWSYAEKMTGIRYTF
ncbi:oxidoreductase [Sinomicrobium oceani]|uniref:oxidoreductase n=1 Tax=Sinomicrobium oceani TaxID=1150368 RepID=UPI00227B38FE|nr:oxidoreductase [Sinomicrobium oceani]